MRLSRILLVVTALLQNSQHSQSIEIGDTICAEGFILDNFCLFINLDNQGRGRLLDTNDVALEEPDQHTLHCLVDVGVCNEGPFFILLDPETEGGMYSVQYQLNDHTDMLALARASGRRGGGCRTCEGGSDGLVRGFRAEVIGVVTHLGDATSPPRIDMASAKASNDLDVVCATIQDEEGGNMSSFWAALLDLLQLLVTILGGGGAN